MLICLVLCAAAVLPTAFSDRPEAQNVQPHPGRNNELARRLAASYAAARNQGLLRLQKYEEARDEAYPYLFDTFITLWARKPYPLYSAVAPHSDSERPLTRSLDQIGGGHLLRRDALLNPVIDEIGGGHLLRRNALDQMALDTVGGLLKRSGFRALDPIGGGHLLKRDSLDEIGGGNLLKRQSLDSIGGGHLLKREYQTASGEDVDDGKMTNSDTNSEAYV